MLSFIYSLSILSSFLITLTGDTLDTFLALFIDDKYIVSKLITTEIIIDTIEKLYTNVIQNVKFF